MMFKNITTLISLEFPVLWSFLLLFWEEKTNSKGLKNRIKIVWQEMEEDEEFFTEEQTNLYT